MTRQDYRKIALFDWNSVEVIICELSGGYALKKDSLREVKKWTAIGPEGHIGPDFRTMSDTITAIEEAQKKAATESYKN